MKRHAVTADYAAVSQVFFCDPPAGAVGLTADQAERGGHRIRVVDVDPGQKVPRAILYTPGLVTDPELSPLDLKLAPSGNIMVASEWPFGAPDAVASVREYDQATGQLVRVLAPDRSVGFRRPRG